MTDEHRTTLISKLTSGIETAALLDSRLLCCVFNTGLQLHDRTTAALMFRHPPSCHTVSTSHSYSFIAAAPAKAMGRMNHDSSLSHWVA